MLKLSITNRRILAVTVFTNMLTVLSLIVTNSRPEYSYLPDFQVFSGEQLVKAILTLATLKEKDTVVTMKGL